MPRKKDPKPAADERPEEAVVEVEKTEPADLQVPNMEDSRRAEKEAAAELPDELFITTLTPQARISHVPRNIAARMIVDGTARISTEEEVEAYKQSTAWPRF